MSLLIPQLEPCLCMLRAYDKDVLCCLPSSATPAERGKDREDSGLEEKSIQADCSNSQLNSQQALCSPEPLMKIQDVRPWGDLIHV